MATITKTHSRAKPIQFNGHPRMYATWYGNDHNGQTIDYRVEISKCSGLLAKPFRVHFLDNDQTELWTEQKISQFENWRKPDERDFFEKNFLSTP